jgi:hypothetical protein
MIVRTFAATIFSCFACVCVARAASAALDVLPAPGGAPAHLRVTQTMTGPDGPRTATYDVVLRRTSQTTAALQQNGDIDPLSVDVDGALHPGSVALASSEAGLHDLLDALNLAHGVMGVAGAGNRPGWTAEIPLPERSSFAQTPSPSPSAAPPLALPIQAVAGGGGIDIDGAVETTLEPPGSSDQPRRSHSRGGGFGGGFGGRGGFGGSRGGDDPGDEGPRGGGAPTIVLDVHVTGHIAAGALTRLAVTQTRRVVVDGLTYTNVATATFDLAR